MENPAFSPPPGDPSHDVLRTRSRALESLLRPSSLALIGATDRPGSVGLSVLSNLKASFPGPLYPVNPKRGEILGLKSYPSVADLPSAPDLAVIATPAPTVPDLVGDCVQRGVKTAVVLSAGFKEMGAPGLELERQVAEKLKGSPLRLLGPNCLGLLNPLAGLNATFAPQKPLPGSVGFLSQSGALGTAILEWSLEAKVGFSSFVSTGSMLDLTWGDLIDALGDDPHTRSILIYMESIGDARAFLSAAREVAFTKPIIVLKAGRTEAAAKAAVSHTGALAGSDEALQAAFRRCGVLWVDRIEDLFHMAEVLSKQPRPKGPRLAIVTNAGGPGVLATDSLVLDGGRIADLSEGAKRDLDAFLPAHWSHGDPVDVLGDAGPDRTARALQRVMEDEGNDGVLAILTPQAMTLPAQTVERFKTIPQGEKPLLTCLMGGRDMGSLRDQLRQAGIPSFAYPDDAARIFNHMWRYNSNLKSLYETPLPSPADEPGREGAALLLAQAQGGGRTLLTEEESKRLLALYRIPVVPTVPAATAEEAVLQAERTGYPVVLKLLSGAITHKSDVGGVRLDLKTPEEVRAAFEGIRSKVLSLPGAPAFEGVTVQPMVRGPMLELILGASPDPQLGPVLLFGMGGTLVEVVRDRALALPPLTSTLALRLMEGTKVYQAFQGVRGMGPVDKAALAGILVEFSRLVCEHPAIREIEINPLALTDRGPMALDARVVLNDPGARASWPRPAIRPYPLQYAGPFTARDGSRMVLRPIRPEDETRMAEFHRTLSENSVYMRYFQALKLDSRIAHHRLVRICFIDYGREMALVAEGKGPGEEGRILGAGRLSRSFREGEMEFSILVGDPWQKKGLGLELLRRLVLIGRAEGLRRLVGYILPENAGMLAIAGKLGFKTEFSKDHHSMVAVLDL